jgi:hypothetical protein
MWYFYHIKTIVNCYCGFLTTLKRQLNFNVTYTMHLFWMVEVISHSMWYISLQLYKSSQTFSIDMKLKTHINDSIKYVWTKLHSYSIKTQVSLAVLIWLRFLFNEKMFVRARVCWRSSYFVSLDPVHSFNTMRD